MPPPTLPSSVASRPVRSLRVEVLEGPDASRIASGGDRLSIGAADSNDLVLSDGSVSRYHLELIRRGDRIEVVDHNSTNGTWAGSAAIVRGFVLPGCTLNVGRSVLRILDGDAVSVELYEGDRLGPIIGRSTAMRELMAKARRTAQTGASVLLTGETGTGKEVVARAIHQASSRSHGPFETVDCGAMLETLMLSELFGHEKGAFTGADRQHVGAFERAHGGTLFLDEIGELPPNLQTVLLGAIERRSFRRIGGSDRISVDVRLICATHRDLHAAVNSGGFRQDLFYRIGVVVLDIPPLRERRDDIPMLVEHFLRQCGSTQSPAEVFPGDALGALATHEWPGNVRELRNVVEATLALGTVPLRKPPQSKGAKEAPGGPQITEDLLALPYSEARGRLLDEFEGQYLRALLERHDDNLTAAARAAEMNRTYLTRLLKRRGVRTRRAFSD
jgi:DNA-binding NtrC family response regulator